MSSSSTSKYPLMEGNYSQDFGPKRKLNFSNGDESDGTNVLQKFVMRQEIEALREYYRIKLYLLREEQRSASKEEKAVYGHKYKQLMDEFDAVKQSVKDELWHKHTDQKLLVKHCLQINNMQTETIKLNSRLGIFQRIIKKKNINTQKSCFDASLHLHGLEELAKSHSISQSQEEMEPAANYLKSDSSRGRTSAEIDSIAEDISSIRSAAESQRDLVGIERDIPKLSISITDKEEEDKKESSPKGVAAEIISTGRSGKTERTSAEIESIPEEIMSLSSGRDASEIVSGRDIQSNSSTVNQTADDLEVNKTHDADEIGEIETQNSTLDEISEDLAFSFKASEKSLKSILTSARTNSIASGRESAGRRRSSASEAILKLRLMNGVPSLPKSPRESKSPPKTPLSPLGMERFMTKFPHQSASREVSFSEEASVGATANSAQLELLDEMPNTSQLGMVLDVSQSPATTEKSKRASIKSRLCTISHHDKFQWQNEIIGKCVNNFLVEYNETGDEFCGDFECSIMEEEDYYNDYQSERSGIIPEILLRQFCYDTMNNLVRTAPFDAVSHHNLSSEQALISHLQEKLADLENQAICSSGVKTRAEKTSHVLLDTNRLLLAQYVYDTMAIWPAQEFDSDNQAKNDQHDELSEVM